MFQDYAQKHFDIVDRFGRFPHRNEALGRATRADEERSEEHTSELQSLMRISYAVFCLKKNTKTHTKLPETKRNKHKTDTKQHTNKEINKTSQRKKLTRK